MAKATDVRPKITLACEECKHRNYITKKNRRNDPDRLRSRSSARTAACTASTARPAERADRRRMVDAGYVGRTLDPAPPYRVEPGEDPRVRPRRSVRTPGLPRPRGRPRGRVSRRRRAADVHRHVHHAADRGVPARPGLRLGLRAHGARRPVVRAAPPGARRRRAGHHHPRRGPVHPGRQPLAHPALRDRRHRRAPRWPPPGPCWSRGRSAA